MGEDLLGRIGKTHSLFAPLPRLLALSSRRTSASSTYQREGQTSLASGRQHSCGSKCGGCRLLPNSPAVYHPTSATPNARWPASSNPAPHATLATARQPVATDARIARRSSPRLGYLRSEQ